MLQLVDGNYNANTTHHLSQMVAVFRQVRRLSRCTVVLVVSHDSQFLAAFAKWSMKSRLLVWATRLLVATRLTLPQLQPLLTFYWTYTMMNAAFLSLNHVSSSYPVFSYLPYTPAGPQVVHVASWTPLLGVIVTEGHMLFPEKFSNFYGSQVNVTALPFAPFWEEQKGTGNITLYSGTDYYTLAAIASALNFTIYVVPTSSWAEVTRLVEERVSFIAPVIHNVMPHRSEKYDFSFVYEYVSMDFSMAPPGLQAQWKALYYPLSSNVWLYTLLALLVMPFVLFIAIRMKHTNIYYSSGSTLEIGEVFHDMTGMLLGQNLPPRLPKISSSRILVATWLVFAIVFTSAYRGNLTASLTLPKYPPRPETLPQLVNSVKRITMQPFGREFKNFFSKSESPLFQKLAYLINIVPTLMDGQNQAIVKNQAHLDNRRYQLYNIAKRFTRRDGSEMLYIGRESIMPGQSAWPLPHDAPYTDVIDRHLMAVIEAGMYEKWASDLLFKVQQESRIKLRQQQQNEQHSDAQVKEDTLSLSISHMQGAFMLLLLCLIFASLVFICELNATGLRHKGHCSIFQ
ncbi:glutamate receptor ionotropic, kainate 2-like [Portunus trituberculatus]|uniref:glutamate receptor ionotropic, kainate 2-like n=1 Tax=Portunus trituberculatus TaxID=210409 RepID=UPI001E1CC756|nr:glutamate receptor ionotropic, kainate 2-like [Portunus trituberculatus]